MAKMQNLWALLTEAYRTGSLKWLWGGRVVFTKRFRATLAEVNAGVTLIDAPGVDYAIRLVDYRVITIGATATGVGAALRIRGTQADATAILAEIALAGLTQSTPNYPGVANNTILADGASFVANDENTAITAANNGTALATATNYVGLYKLYY